MRVSPPFIRTPRLVLRLAGREDVPAILEYLTANRDHLTPFEPAWPADMLCESLWISRVTFFRQEFERGTLVRLFLFDLQDPRRVVGGVGLSQIVHAPWHACFLGYALDATFEGRGYMREALKAILPWAFGELGLHRVMANYMPHNVRSARLLRSLGFVVEGYARDYLRINNRWEDHVLTSLINCDWQAPSASEVR